MSSRISLKVPGRDEQIQHISAEWTHTSFLWRKSVYSETLWGPWFYVRYSIILITVMEHTNEIRKLLRQIMSKPPEPTMTPQEIHFDVLAMDVLELVVLISAGFGFSTTEKFRRVRTDIG